MKEKNSVFSAQTYQKIEPLLAKKPVEYQSVCKKLIELGQFPAPEKLDEKSLDLLLEKLVGVENFYKEIGGITGYQNKILELLQAHAVSESDHNQTVSYHPPSWVDISEETPEVWESLFDGIDATAVMAEMVPLGGAADRLHLIDEKTGSELPAAKLSFSGRPLLSAILRDLQAREYLYYKIYGKQITVPLAFMTSEEKDNHLHVEQLMEENGWFGRPKESFRFFKQPLVPVVSEKGDWCWVGPFKPLMKPGGHGAIWKLARDQGVFDWLKQKGCKKALIRQINNPLAGIDYGILAFTGFGTKKNMLFGFASCPRLPNTAEGVNVLLEKGNQIVLTNVEYCDFVKAGIEDLLLKETHRFSSNTNILFADLEALEKAVELCPYPGLLINLKQGSYTTETGEKKEELLARLESTMQNIGDVFVEEKNESLQTQRTYVTYNHRGKTISTAKKAYLAGKGVQETPEKCFYDLLSVNRELLVKRCHWQLPAARSLEEYLRFGPEALFLYHPALGPLHSIISQKLKGGVFSLGSEMQLEIADLDFEKIELNGSLWIHADQIMGKTDPFLHFSEQTGRCVLKNVSISNRGVDWAKSAPFWRNELHRVETLEISLKGHSEFIAEDVVFSGPFRFEVPDGIRMRVLMKEGNLEIIEEKIDNDPFWIYEKSDKILLKRKSGEGSRR